MNRFWTVVVSLLLVLGGGCQPTAPATPPSPSPKGPVSPANPGTVPVTAKLQPLLRWHSLGLQSVTNGTGGTRLKELVALSESGALKSSTLAKLSHTLPAILFPEAPTNQDQAARLKPLLEDVLTYESKVVWASASPLRWRVAVKIPVERTGVWTLGLYDLLVRGEYLSKIPHTNITDTSVTVPYSAAETYRYGLKDGWVTVERAEPGYDWSVVAQTESPVETNAWLALELQTSLSAQAAKILPPDNLPYARLTMEGKGENQTSRLSLKFPKALEMKIQPWLVPTNTIKDPVISFTAIQGLDGWWSRQDWLKPLGLASAPQQAYMWAQPEAPFATFAAIPAKGASALVHDSMARWTNQFNAAISNRFFGSIVSLTNEMVWTGLPIIVPTLKAAPEPRDDHLLLGLFPLSQNPANLPAALLQQFVGQPKLMYYDWELTEARLKQWMQLAPLLSMAANQMPVTNSKLPYEWLAAAAPHLGNSVTQAELVAPDEIQVLRRSPAGFSGLELYFLARWLDQNEFPGWDPELDPVMSPPGFPPAPPAPGK